MDGNGDGTAMVDMGAHEAFITSTGLHLGITAVPGTRITQCLPVDPQSITEMRNRPNDLILGLIQTQSKVHEPGATATFTIQLPEPAPPEFNWYLHSSQHGWIDFSRQRISGGTGDGAQWNDDRTQVTFYVTDNGPFDDDPTEGYVKDPVGMATPPLPGISTDSTSLDFGTVMLNIPAIKDIFISNQGTGDLTIDNAAIIGPDAHQFELAFDDCSGKTFSFQDNATVSIRYLAAAPGNMNATLAIASNDPNHPTKNIDLIAHGFERKLTTLAINGPNRIDELSSAQYTCTAAYNDNTTTDVTGEVTWSDSSDFAKINNQGYLSTMETDGDMPCQLKATYEGQSATFDIAIMDRSISPSKTKTKSGGGGSSGCFISTLRFYNL
jgi:hypothetical protein